MKMSWKASWLSVNPLFPGSLGEAATLLQDKYKDAPLESKMGSESIMRHLLQVIYEAGEMFTVVCETNIKYTQGAMNLCLLVLYYKHYHKTLSCKFLPLRLLKR